MVRSVWCFDSFQVFLIFRSFTVLFEELDQHWETYEIKSMEKESLRLYFDVLFGDFISFGNVLEDDILWMTVCASKVIGNMLRILKSVFLKSSLDVIQIDSSHELPFIDSLIHQLIARVYIFVDYFIETVIRVLSDE